MRRLIFLVIMLVAGCAQREEKWKTGYYAEIDRWEAAYSGADASAAYNATVVYADYLKKMQSDGVPFDAAKVLVWVYPRLGLLAEHLGKKEEAERYFAVAVKHARSVHPEEPEGKTSEAAFRAALDQMDTPEKVLWRKAPNQSSQPTPTSRRGS